MSRGNEEELIRMIALKLIEQARNKGRSLSMDEAVTIAIDHVATIDGITARMRPQPSDAEGFFARLKDVVRGSGTTRGILSDIYGMRETWNEKTDMDEVMATLLYVLMTQFPDLYLYYAEKNKDEDSYAAYVNYANFGAF